MRTRGFTILELVVVLAVLGVILGVSGVALASLRVPRESRETADLRRARAEAIHSGLAQTAHGARFLPDGRVIGGTVDPLTGVPRAK